MRTGEWRKYPAVTTGGKPYFYRLYSNTGEWQAAVVWNRRVRAYAVDVAGGIHLGYLGTVAAGKRAAVTYLNAQAEPPSHG